MLFTFGIGNAWAEEENISFESYTSSGTGTTYTYTWDANTSCTIIQEKGNASSSVNTSYNTTPRWYAGHLISFIPKNGCTITKVVISTSGSKNGQDMTLTIGEGTITKSGNTTTISGSWNSTFQLKMGQQCQGPSVTITYETASTTPKEKYTLTYQAGSASGSIEVEEGANLLEALNGITPVACDASSTEPIGWTESEISGKQATEPTLLTDESVMPSNDHKVYYVFANEETIDGGVVNNNAFSATLGGSSGDNISSGYKLKYEAEKKAGYYQDGSGDVRYVQIISTSPMFTSTPNSITVTAKIGGGTSNKTLSNPVEAQLVDKDGELIGSAVTITEKITTNTGDSYEVNVPTTGITSAYGLRISHKKESGYNVRYYSMSLSYTTSGTSTIFTDYTTSCDGSTQPVVSLTDEQLKWSATTATALKGADNNEFPTLTNELSVPVTYTSSNTSVATIEADGKITLVAPGTTTISAAFVGGEVGGTTYAAKTVTYTLTVKQLVSCADIYNLADDATFVLKDFVVTYVNGKYTYIKDDTGYGLIYKDSYGLNAGDQVASGKFEGKRNSYNGLVEIIPTTEVGDLGATPGIAPDPEVMNTNPTEDDMNKYVKLKNVSFASTAFSSKSINGTIEGQGSSIKFYDQFTTDKTFDTSKKYDVIGVVSMFNSVQVNFISAEEVAEPTLNLTTTPIDFGKVAINSTNESTLQLSGSLLTKDITLSVEGDSYFTVSPNSITPSEGSVNETITITYKPTVEDTHIATLKITSDELAEQTITLQGQAVQQHTVHFFVNGEEQTDLAKKVLSGNTLEELPTATSCDLLNYPTFAGWASAEIVGTTDVKPTMLDLSTPITSDCNYYAVFEKGTTSSGSTTSAIMKYTGGTTTNMKDGNNAATVGLDETLFNITSTKTASGTHVGLNRANDIRLYANKTDGNGNILTIAMAEGYTITQISLDIKQTATFVVKANGQSISGTYNVYDINHSSCSIQNTTTGDVATQLLLNSITIEYTTSTTTYEYITSCAAVVPTCEITYDFAGGEGECTNDIVEEGAEYTLCATAPTKTGHTFVNWKDQNGDEYEAGATINSVTEDLTLTAQWQINSYKVTWMSLGDEVASANVEYNSQPTKPATDPTYTCYGEKEFVGWTTKEIDGVGTPENLYTDEFPVVTESITYYAVFATRISEGSNLSKAITLANGDIVYLATENGLGISGANDVNEKDATVSTIQNEWLSFTVETTDNTLFQFKNGEKYITAGAKQFKLTTTASNFTFSNGYIVYEISSGSDQGDYVLLENTNNGTFYRFYKISNMGAANYTTFYVYKDASFTDYITSCDAVTSSISIDDISMCVGDVHTITPTTIKPATAASAVSYTIKENATNAISLSGNTITARAEGTATITATIEDATDYAGSSIDFKVTVDAAPVTSKVVILAQHGGQWYAMKAEYYEENKSLNAIPVTYVNGTLYNVADSEKDAIEWERTTRGNTATFKIGENYLIGTTGTDLKLGDIAFEWAVDGNLYLCDDNKRTFIFNKEGYFKNYAQTNYSNGVAIDATYSSLPVVTAPVYATGDAYGRTVTAGNYGTICLPFGGTITGAVLYECVGKEEGKVYLGSVTELEAGVPYIFQATATELAVYSDGTTAATPGTHNGLHGTFTNGTEVAAGNYILKDNKLCQAADICYVNAYRAYLDLSAVEGGKPNQMPGRRYIGMSVQGENGTTGLDNIMTTEAPAKVIVNGQLIIIRDGVKYNVQGQKL